MARLFILTIFISLSITITACKPVSLPETETKIETELNPESTQTPITYWTRKQRLGANSFNDKPPSQDYFDALADYGAEWVRLSWTKWESATGKSFLLGDPSDYSGLVEADVTILRDVIARADQSGLKVVLTPLTLPGAVWTQHNNEQIDDRLYTDKKYWEYSAAFWSDVAIAFKNEPAVAAFNLLNEPAPERPVGYESGTTEENALWYDKQKGTARDLPALYNFIIAEIRLVDAQTPIMVDGGFFANPEGFDYFSEPLKDENILYDFHMYQPWAATSAWNIRNGSKLIYPGEMEIWGRTEVWNEDKILQTIRQPIDWAQKHGVDMSRIVMGEFGCHRYLEWCPVYLEDVLHAADSLELHWAFYTFRSDSWGGMDYELGSKRPSKKSLGITAEEFWELSAYKRLGEVTRSNTQLFEPIRRRLIANKKMH